MYDIVKEEHAKKGLSTTFGGAVFAAALGIERAQSLGVSCTCRQEYFKANNNNKHNTQVIHGATKTQLDLWCNLAIKLTPAQLEFLAERVQKPDDRLKIQNVLKKLTKFKEQIFCDFTLLRCGPLASLSFEDWKAYLDRRWEHFVLMGGRFNPTGGLVHWKNFYGNATEARKVKVVKFGIAAMKYCALAVTSAKQTLRLLAEQADKLDADFESASKTRLADMEDIQGWPEDRKLLKEAIGTLTTKLGRPDSKFPREPVMPEMPEWDAYLTRGSVPYPEGTYNPMANPGKVDDPLLDLIAGSVDARTELINAMKSAEVGKLDAALYNTCNTQFEAQDKKNANAKNKDGPDGFLPTLTGTEKDKANLLPQSMGRPISRLQSLLLRRRQELVRYHVSESFHLSSIVQKLMMSCNV